MRKRNRAAAPQLSQVSPPIPQVLIREAGARAVAAAQSTTSLVPPLGNDKAKVLTLNLRNRLIFGSADEADAVQADDFLGKKRVVTRSWG